jgi:hypothetical protein
MRGPTEQRQGRGPLAQAAVARLTRLDSLSSQPITARPFHHLLVPLAALLTQASPKPQGRYRTASTRLFMTIHI